MNINNANSPSENIYNESNDDDEFYVQPDEEEEYKAYLREPVANKKVFISINTITIIKIIIILITFTRLTL